MPEQRVLPDGGAVEDLESLEREIRAEQDEQPATFEDDPAGYTREQAAAFADQSLDDVHVGPPSWRFGGEPVPDLAAAYAECDGPSRRVAFERAGFETQQTENGGEMEFWILKRDEPLAHPYEEVSGE